MWAFIVGEGYRVGVFKNRVLRKILWRKRDEITGKWRRLHSEEHYDFYSPPNIICLIISRKLRWSGHVAHTGEDRCLQCVCWETRR
jgi:hypothetical protein